MPDQIQEPLYENKELGIRFVRNLRDPPHGFDVYVGEDHFYMQDRILPDLASRQSTRSVKSALEAMTQCDITYILDRNGVSYEQLHLAMAQVMLKDVEDERDELISERNDYNWSD